MDIGQAKPRLLGGRAERMSRALQDTADRLSALASAVRDGGGLVPFASLAGQPQRVIVAFADICKSDGDEMARVMGESLVAAYAPPSKQQKPARVSARAGSELRLVGGAK